MIIKIPEEYDSKFRFIMVAAERAKQLQNGAPRRIEVESGKAAFVGIREAERNMVKWEILEEEREEALELAESEGDAEETGDEKEA